MLNLHKSLLLVLTICCSYGISLSCQAQFVSKGELTVLETFGTNHDDIVFDGENWYITRPFTGNISIYDESFEFIETVAVPGVLSANGLAYIADDDVFFIADGVSNVVREITISEGDNGFEVTVLGFYSVFSNSSTTNGMAYDPMMDTLWSTSFGGRIDQRLRQDDPVSGQSQGALLSTFNANFPAVLGDVDGIAGMTIDTFNRSVFVVTFFPPAVVEYDFDGTLIDVVVPTSELAFGQKLGGFPIPTNMTYDSDVGLLTVVIDVGAIVQFSDPSRAPFLLGDVNMDGVVDLLDIGPFIDLLNNNGFLAEADINQDGTVDLLDIPGFVSLLTRG